jgi:hypothetical protein
MRILLIGWFLLVPALCHAADAWRTFTDDKGRKMVAKILHVEASFVVVELKADGRQIPIDFEKLSEADVAFLRKYKPDASTTEPTDPQDEAADAPGPEGEPETGRLYPRTRREIQDGIREIEKRPKRPDHSLPASGEIPGRQIKINHVSLGMNAINFEPEEPAKRGIYWVRISGGGVHEGYLVELY